MHSDQSGSIVTQKAVAILLDLSKRQGPPPARFVTISAEGEPALNGWLFSLSEIKEFRLEINRAIRDLEGQQ